MRRSVLTGVFALGALLVASAAATAYDGNRPHAFRHADPGDVDYYALVLSWSPTHCLTEGRQRGDEQCNSGSDADFVLHGLWPQYDFGWPEDCYRGPRPWVPSDVIGEIVDKLSNKTIDMLSGFVDEHFPKPPGYEKDIPRPVLVA